MFAGAIAAGLWPTACAVSFACANRAGGTNPTDTGFAGCGMPRALLTKRVPETPSRGSAFAWSRPCNGLSKTHTVRHASSQRPRAALARSSPRNWSGARCIGGIDLLSEGSLVVAGGRCDRERLLSQISQRRRIRHLRRIHCAHRIIHC